MSAIDTVAESGRAQAGLARTEGGRIERPPASRPIGAPGSSAGRAGATASRAWPAP